MTSRASLSTALQGYSTYLGNASGFQPQTSRRYLYEIQRLERALGREVLDSSPADILAWHSALVAARYSSHDVRQRHSALKNYLTYLSDFLEEERAEPLLRALRKLKVPAGLLRPSQSYALSEEEFELLLDGCEKHISPALCIRDRALLYFLWDTALRAGEVGALRLSDLRLHEREATVKGKGGKSRLLFFSPACQEALEDWLEEKERWRGADPLHLFLSSLGRPLGSHGVWDVVQRVAHQAGFRRKLWPHIFRHSRITHLLERGVTLQDVGAIVGHARPATTAGYYHPDTAHLKARYDEANG